MSKLHLNKIACTLILLSVFYKQAKGTPLQQYPDCDFEVDECSWTHDESAVFKWTRHIGKTPSGRSYNTGPGINTSKKDYYMYTESSNPRLKGDKARLESPYFVIVQDLCMMVSYNLHGKGIGSLVVYIKNNTARYDLLTVSGNHGDAWFTPIINLSKHFTVNQQVRVGLEGVIGDGYEGDLAIDDVKFITCPDASTKMPTTVSKKITTKSSKKYATVSTTGHPTTTETTTTTTTTTKTTTPTTKTTKVTTATTAIKNTTPNCDFDTPGNDQMCSWTNNGDDDIDWNLHKGPTQSTDTGPSTDSSGNGYYMYVEASNYYNKFARLESPLVSVNYDCVKFKYHMYGREIEKLSVYVNVGGVRKYIWTKKGTGLEKDTWKEATLTMTAIVSNYSTYQLGFEGHTGNDFQSDIAIDDIRFDKCSDSHEFKSFECDFESSQKDMCDWLNDLTDNFDWKKRRGQTPTPSTGPSTDASNNTMGTYLFIESSEETTRNKFARIVTPAIVTSKQCFKFSYHMFGVDIASLKVYIYVSQGPRHDIWNKTGSQGDKWIEESIDLRAYIQGVKGFQLGIEAQNGNGRYGDIAIDNLKFHVCPDIPKKVELKYDFCQQNKMDCCGLDNLGVIFLYNIPCCAEKAYNRKTHSCCGTNNLYKKSEAVGCCNGVLYDTKLQECCGQKTVSANVDCATKPIGLYEDSCNCVKYYRCSDSKIRTHHSCPLYGFFHNGTCHLEHRVNFLEKCNSRDYKAIVPRIIGDMFVEINVAAVYKVRGYDDMQVLFNETDVVTSTSLYHALSEMTTSPHVWGFHTLEVEYDVLKWHTIKCLNLYCKQNEPWIITVNGDLIDGIDFYRPNDGDMIELRSNEVYYEP